MNRSTYLHVLVSPHRLRNGTWSKRRIVWASFYIPSEGYAYIRRLSKRSPDWIIESKEVTRP